jgi:hypothetical protein
LDKRLRLLSLDLWILRELHKLRESLLSLSEGTREHIQFLERTASAVSLDLLVLLKWRVNLEKFIIIISLSDINYII